jgi:hypothetical protein
MIKLIFFSILWKAEETVLVKDKRCTINSAQETGWKTVGQRGRGVSHFIPQALQPTGDWWFVCDEEVVLHFCPAQFTRAKTVPQLDDRWPRLLFYTRSDAERPALILEPDGGP